jgi:hypothetical protein
MATDHIRYDILAQDALRGVVRTVLTDAAKNGLPGEHHFYITLDTQSEGVRLSQRMRAQYPEEITIVLQHEFWDLAVGDKGFEVGLSFGGVRERLAVPFDAIKRFVDPSVQFALQFEEVVVDGEDAGEEVAPASRPDAQTPRPVPSVSAVPTPLASVSTKDSAKADSGDDDPDKPAGSAEVVRLDRFRKK